VVVWAGDRERTWAEQIAAGSQGHARLAPATSLMELAALLGRARLVVGSDTGPLHLAAAVGTRCVSLHGPTLAAQSGPYGPGHRALQEVYLEGTSRNRRHADNASMKRITADKACRACDEVLAELREAPTPRHVA
jgi:ADP-heptose:LPS heptosyltransferase